MKRTLTLIGLAVLGIAFAAVSLWVMLSGGRSARATRTKFRLGGIMLSLSAMLSLSSCSGDNPFFVSCYDPAPPPTNELRWGQGVANSQLRNGDKVMFRYECSFGNQVKVMLLTDDNGEARELCSQSYEVTNGDHNLEFTIDTGDYRGRAKLCAEYDKYQDENDSVGTFDSTFVLIVD